MKEAWVPVVSDQAREAIKKSTDFSLALHALQPEVVKLPSFTGEDGRVIEDAQGKLLRLRMATALWSVSMDHHVALVFLCQNHMRSSAFGLLRMIFDAVWRGAWVAYLASQQELEQFAVNRYDPSPDAAIKRLEASQGLPPILSQLKKHGWRAMSAYVHSGSLQVQRWVGEDGIGPRHSDEELIEVLDHADRLAFLACLLFLDIVGEDKDKELEAAAAKFLA